MKKVAGSLAEMKDTMGHTKRALAASKAGVADSNGEIEELEKDIHENLERVGKMEVAQQREQDEVSKAVSKANFEAKQDKTLVFKHAEMYNQLAYDANKLNSEAIADVKEVNSN